MRTPPTRALTNTHTHTAFEWLHTRNLDGDMNNRQLIECAPDWPTSWRDAPNTLFFVSVLGHFVIWLESPHWHYPHYCPDGEVSLTLKLRCLLSRTGGHVNFFFHSLFLFSRRQVTEWRLMDRFAGAKVLSIFLLLGYGVYNIWPVVGFPMLYSALI